MSVTMVSLRLIAVVSASALLCSCASVKIYPVCFFNPAPPEKEEQSKYIEKLTLVLQRFDETAAPSQDGRWIIARTNIWGHRKLQEIWPPLGCVGTVTSGTEVARSSDCIQFISEQLRSGDYKTLDVKRDDVVLSDEAPGKPYVICSRSVD